jgi:hypothetical protein
MPKPYADLVGLKNRSTNHAFDQVDTTSLFLLAKISKVQTQLVRDSQVEECETISCKIFLEFEKSKKTQSCKPVRQKGFSSVCRLSAAFVIPPEGIIIHWNGCPEM